MDAFVLIGGRSARMGTDKAELMVAGQRMADRVSAALMPHSASVRFVGKCRPDWLEPVDFVADGAEARHPLHGVRAAMESARTPWVLIAPCDLVALRAEDVAQLVARTGPAVAYSGQDVQPLLAKLPVSWLPRVVDWIAADAPARRLADDAHAVELPDSALLNVNLHADLERFIDAIGRHTKEGGRE